MTFDDILAGCIEALEQGATVDECLARYPAQAAALEPLLRVVVALCSEAPQRMSSQAFARGRNALRQHAQQAIQHRPPPHQPARLAAPQQNRQATHARYGQNGATLPQRSPVIKRLPTSKSGQSGQSRWGRAMSRVLSTALLLVLLVAATSLTRRVMSSLPGTFFYPIKNVGERSLGVLMQAAGEEIPWHAIQAENGLQTLAQLSQSEAGAVQALVNVIEEHWETVLTATQRLPVAERVLVLQARITRLQQLEAQWATTQTERSPQLSAMAVLTVRKMVAAGEQLLAAPVAVETVSTTAPTATPVLVQTPMPTTIQPTATALLQATATPVTAPILVATATPSATNVTIPATATPSPTLLATTPPPATPMPVITAQISQESNNQESNSQGSEDRDTDEDKNNSDVSESATSEPATNAVEGLTPEVSDTLLESAPTVQTPEAVTTIDAPVSDPVGATVEPMVPTPAITPVIGEPPTTPIGTPKGEESTEEPEAPPVTTPVESTPLVPSKGTSSAAAAEPPAMDTPRPTNQPAATKTPKPTATSDKSTATPDKPTTAAPLATSVEKTPKPAAQPTETPRPTSLTNESTKVAQP